MSCYGIVTGRQASLKRTKRGAGRFARNLATQGIIEEHQDVPGRRVYEKGAILAADGHINEGFFVNLYQCAGVSLGVGGWL